MLKNIFADLHIHIGNDKNNKPVKISASKNLTLSNILIEANERKGIELVGVVDCHNPHVQEEIENLLETNLAKEIPLGGIRFGKVTLILGCEVEINDDHCRGPIHVLCFFPALSKMKQFTEWLRKRVTNIYLSSQRYYGTAYELQMKVKELDGLFIPAHVFTPFKSLYGKGVEFSLTEVFDPTLIDGIELGLSSDSMMASQIEELSDYTFLSNSDAHSLAKIGREYQEITLAEANFTEFNCALQNKDGRKISRNFGLNPLLGKYYTTVCINGHKLKAEETECPICHTQRIIKGVAERINELSSNHKIKGKRPKYIYQVPLDFLPKLGLKTYEKLIKAFQTEMNIIHHVSYEDLIKVVPQSLAENIIAMRNGKLEISAGGGGKYGKVK